MTKYGVTPDIVCLAKALGGGMPLGVCRARRGDVDAHARSRAGTHNHPSAAIRYAALRVGRRCGMSEEHGLAGAERMGALYEELLRDHPRCRRYAAAVCCWLWSWGSSERLYRIWKYSSARVSRATGSSYCDTAFRISPPLVITEERCATAPPSSAAAWTSCCNRSDAASQTTDWTTYTLESYESSLNQLPRKRKPLVLVPCWCLGLSFIIANVIGSIPLAALIISKAAQTGDANHGRCHSEWRHRNGRVWTATSIWRA